MGSSSSSVDCNLYDTFNVTQEAADLYFPIDMVRFSFNIFISCAAALGVFSNVTFLFVLFRNPNLRSETDVYITNLSLADLMYGTMAAVQLLPSTVSSNVVFQTTFTSSTQCLVFILPTYASFYASVALVTMVSFERYLALCHPIKHLRIRGKRRTYKLVASCWLFGLLVSCLIAPSYSKYQVKCYIWPDKDIFQDYPSYTSYCTTTTSEQSFVTIFNLLQVIPWIISMSSTAYMYARIILKLHKRRAPSSGSGSSKDQKAQRVRNQVAKMLIVNGLAFFLCQTPIIAVTLTEWIFLSTQTFNFNFIKYYIGRAPQLINVFINPFIYGAMSSQYRAAFLRAFNCKVSPKIPPSSTTVHSTHDPRAPKASACLDSTETLESHL